MWIRTENGLNVRDGDGPGFSRYRFEDAHSAARMDTIFESANGDIWVANADGFFRLGAGATTFRSVPADPATFPDGNWPLISAITEDEAGHLWLGTRRGLIDYEPTTGHARLLEHVPDRSDSLPHNDIYTLFTDAAGTVWGGTIGGGLFALDTRTGAFRAWRNDPTDTASLPHNQVLDVSEDADGVLWVSTTAGLESSTIAARRSDG